MSILYECKCCGGELVQEAPGIGRCKSCRKPQTMPLAIDLEHINRANRLRMLGCFEDAGRIYDAIIEKCPDEAEAYWGRVLCRFGILYIKDYDETLVPTCYLTVAYSILEDPDYVNACKYAGSEREAVYKKQASLIDRIQDGIWKNVSKAKQYDIFICYKASDKENNPTEDSQLAEDLYDKLTKQGYSVFCAKESLALHAGEEYEPYIYAALTSAEVMLLIASSEEYVDSPWVRNEWERYLHLQKGRMKHLIVLNTGVDIKKLPHQLSRLQAINWDADTGMEMLQSNLDRIFGKADASEDKVLDNALAKREFAKAEIKLKNAIVLMEAGKRKRAVQLLREIIRDYPDYSDAYWHKMLVSLGYDAESISGATLDISDNADYIAAVNNATQKQREYYISVKEQCILNKHYTESYAKAFNENLEAYICQKPGVPYRKDVEQIQNDIEHCIESGVYEKEISYQRLVKSGAVTAVIITILLIIGSKYTESGPFYYISAVLAVIYAAYVALAIRLNKYFANQRKICANYLKKYRNLLDKQKAEYLSSENELNRKFLEDKPGNMKTLQLLKDNRFADLCDRRYNDFKNRIEIQMKL